MSHRKKPQYRPQSLTFTDRAGRRVRKVPLDREGRDHAKVLESDYQRLVRMGVTGAWFGHMVDGKKYVQTSVKTAKGWQTATIARLLLGEPKGGVVRYVDGDPTDLTPENIIYINRKDHS